MSEPALYITQEEPKTRCVIFEESFVVVNYTRDMPCWWHRLWYKFLLGWTWEKI